MGKNTTSWLCSECGDTFAKWMGQCPSCGEWDTLKEWKEPKAHGDSRDANFRSNKSGYAGSAGAQKKLVNLNEVSTNDLPRISTGFMEFDRCLGSGLVQSSVILLGGNPGAGKSTLLLQVCAHLAKALTVVYCSGEEALDQIALRAKRLKLDTSDLKMLSETSVEDICETASAAGAKVLIVDSIQVCHLSDVTSSPGSPSQIRESGAYLTRFAKQTGTIVILVGHVTKSGDLAGPKVLEHQIDCSIMLEGTSDSRYRLARSTKNRYGAVNEIGVFAMMDSGMKEVSNPSGIFLQRPDKPSPGSVATAIWEGSRPLLVDIQALVDESNGNPRRLAVGIDSNRLSLNLAVLNRHGRIAAGNDDVYVSVVGGLKLDQTAHDLAVVASIFSSFKDRAIPHNVITFGELGLSGEVRAIQNGYERLKEASKHGFTDAIVPKANSKTPAPIKGLKIHPVSDLSEVIGALDDVMGHCP